MSRRAPVIAILPLLALAVTGCGASNAPDGVVDAAESPLSKYMMAIYGISDDEEEWQKQAIEQSKETETLVAACMGDEGFEYTPQENNISFDAGIEWKPDSQEWVEQYGYGSVNFPGRDEQPDPEDVPQDPNQDYVASLSESEQAAYYEVLYGVQPTEDELAEDGSFTTTWEQQGCYGQASHEVQGDDPMQLEKHKPLTDAIQAFWEKSSSAPGLAEIDEAWASCMAEGGYSGFTKQVDAQTSIQDELNAYYESQTEFVENDPELAEIGTREIELALVDLDCREKTDYRAKAQKISFALEEQFIADHKSELEALKADAEQGRK